MWTNLRFKLAQFIIGKSGVILDAQTEVVTLADDGNNALEIDVSPQAMWRETRKQLVGDHHEP